MIKVLNRKNQTDVLQTDDWIMQQWMLGKQLMMVDRWLKGWLEGGMAAMFRKRQS